MSEDYDNFVGKKAEVEKKGTLKRWLGIKDEEPWEKHWVGMPEFEQEADPNHKELLVKFKTAEDYDNFVGKKAEVEKKGTLNEFLGIKDEEPWEKQWVGMPEFEQEADPNYKELLVKFKTKEDYEKFKKLIEQKLTVKTKSIFYPKDDRVPNRLLRWIVDD